MKKWLPLTEAQAWDELTELWVSGKAWAGIDITWMLPIRDESMKELVSYISMNELDKAREVLKAFCDEFLSKNPKVIQAYIREKNDENAEDDCYLDDPRRGQARYLVEAV